MTEFLNDVLHTFNKTSNLFQFVQIGLSTVVNFIIYQLFTSNIWETCFKPVNLQQNKNVQVITYYKISKFENKQRKLKITF